MLGGLTLFTRGSELTKSVLIFAAIGLFIAFIISLLLKKKKPMLIILSAALLFSMIFSNLYFDKWFYASNRFDGEVRIKGTLTELISENYYTTIYIIKTESINDESASSYKLSVYFDNDDAAMFSVGDVVEFSATLKPHSNQSSSTYNYSRGISAICEDVSDIILHDERRFVIENYFSNMRDYLTRHAIFLSDKNSGQMVSALLFGERNALSPQITLDFERLGITHILALSGMHLTLLSLAVEKILSLFSVHKKIRVIIGALLAFFYMAFTGFPSSVLRAGLMLIVSSVIYLIAREPDSITVLFISVAVIIFISPYAIYDIALWLSAFATLGVLVYSDYKLKEKNKKKNKIIKYISESLGISAFAITATLFITHFSFDGISVISPIATLIFTILTTVIMYIGALMLILGMIIPLGHLIIPIVKFTSDTAAVMSSINIYVSKNHIIIDIIVVILTILFFAFLTFKIKKKKIAVLLILSVFSSLYLVAGTLGEIKRLDDIVYYATEENHNNFIIRSNGESAIISSSSYSKSSGYFALSALRDMGVTRLDNYCVQNLTSGVKNELDVVLSNILTEKLYIPKPKNEEEDYIVKELYGLTDDYRTEIYIYDEFCRPKVGKFEIVPMYSAALGESAPKNAFFIHGNDENILYLSSGIVGGNKDKLADELLHRASTVVLGNHGTNYKNPIYFSADYKNLKKIIFDAEYIFMTQDTAIKYNEKGCEIYSHPKSVIIFD